MHRAEVSSSSLHSVGYDPRTSTLEIQFRRGGVYRYFGVSAGVYRELMSAESKGRYFARVIRSTYRYRRVARAGRNT